ncbi:DUF4143 domain-containing protein [Halomonas sp. TRM85114]|nr:DUF4143 domain-containing protein [Halomonas jincaotanensis]MBS9403295.1 DUF4143 domain-containing protein [Halomonas jincaotanensis]
MLASLADTPVVCLLGPRQNTKYLSILERLFLVRQLPAWHCNQAKRLFKSPKPHLVDTGLAAALERLTPDQ